MNTASPDVELARIHRKQLLNFESWVETARNLREVADILLPAVDQAWKASTQHHVIDTHFMLCAYSLENYLKAYIVKTDEAAVAQEIDRYLLNKRPRPCIFTHELHTLAERAKLPAMLAGDGRNLLVRLSHAAQWSARYPTATHPAGIALPVTTSLGPNYVVTHFRSNDDRRGIQILMDYLEKKIGPTMRSSVPLTRCTTPAGQEPRLG